MFPVVCINEDRICRASNLSQKFVYNLWNLDLFQPCYCKITKSCCQGLKRSRLLDDARNDIDLSAQHFIWRIYRLTIELIEIYKEISIFWKWVQDSDRITSMNSLPYWIFGIFLWNEIVQILTINQCLHPVYEICKHLRITKCSAEG